MLHFDQINGDINEIELKNNNLDMVDMDNDINSIII